MVKFDVLVVDPPYSFSDKLKMSDVKRSADSQYNGTLSINDIKELPVSKITQDDAVLFLWVPSSLLQEGLDIMKTWGFKQTQTHVWTKTKKDPLESLRKKLKQAVRIKDKKDLLTEIDSLIDSFDLSEIVSCFMGRLFRQTHEVALVGVKGKIYNKLQDKSQRSVHFGFNGKHSAKPEHAQDFLDKMFPSGNKIEIFARRQKTNWTCLGNENKMTEKEDVLLSLKKLIDLTDVNEKILKELISSTADDRDQKLFDFWSKL